MSTKGLQVVVKFPAEVSFDAQGRSLLAFELNLRQLTGQDVRVVKDLMGDDSKLRVMMTPEMRAKL